MRNLSYFIYYYLFLIADYPAIYNIIIHYSSFFSLLILNHSSIVNGV